MGDLVGHAAVDLVADLRRTGIARAAISGRQLPSSTARSVRFAALNERHDVRCQRDSSTKGRHERRPGVDALHLLDHMDRPAEAAGFELVEEVGARSEMLSRAPP